ncbi:MAG: hypothetical protein RR540_03015, partial [Oscillospiraceae bacterium]
VISPPSKKVAEESYGLFFGIGMQWQKKICHKLGQHKDFAFCKNLEEYFIDIQPKMNYNYFGREIFF